MKLQLFTFHCEQCGSSFEAPLMPVDAYGTFLLRSPATGELACLDAQADKTYDEVDGLLKASPRLAGMTPGLRARVLHSTYGEIACDPDSAARPFSMNAVPACPACGPSAALSWAPVAPARFTEVEVPAVTHGQWERLSDAEKRDKVEQVLAVHQQGPQRGQRS